MSRDKLETMDELIDEFQEKLRRKNKGLMLTINLDIDDDKLDIDVKSIDIKLENPKKKETVTAIIED